MKRIAIFCTVTAVIMLGYLAMAQHAHHQQLSAPSVITTQDEAFRLMAWCITHKDVGRYNALAQENKVELDALWQFKDDHSSQETVNEARLNALVHYYSKGKVSIRRAYLNDNDLAHDEYYGGRPKVVGAYLMRVDSHEKRRLFVSGEIQGMHLYEML